MKNTIVYIMVLGLFLASCASEDEITLDPFEYSPKYEMDTTTILGKKVQEIFDKYESYVIYNWDGHFLSNNAIATPPSTEKVYDFISYMEEAWFSAYPDTFLRDNLPREIVLTSSDINYGEGSGGDFGAAGLAESQYRIVVGLVDYYDVNYDAETMYDYTYQQEKIMHHEFGHILNKRYGIPDEFVRISEADYLQNTHYSALDDSLALTQGFIRPYGASNVDEDFATLVETITTRSAETILNEMWASYRVNNNRVEIVEIWGITKYPKLYAKYQIVLDYYAKLGIDVQEIGNKAEARYIKLFEDEE